MTWAVAEAKAKFSEVLDRAETAGPQVVTRRKREFVVMTREESDRRMAAKVAETPKPFVSAWDALGPPDMELFDVDFPRSKSKGRAVKF
jgi:prevent-host-death family protein